MKCIAIIPARSGSKGLKDKNIKEIAGKPLLAYSIIAAKEAGIFEEIMVSTDSELYADIAREWGANVPFFRSEANSSDMASSWDTVLEVLNKYRKSGKQFDAFCLLQPTSPLRTAEDIVNAYMELQKTEFAVVSVCEVDHSPLWCNCLPDNLSMDGFISRKSDKQRQVLEEFYRVNGAIYFVRTIPFYEDQFLYRKGTVAYIMDKKSSIDIDSGYDFQMAELLMTKDSKYIKNRRSLV